MVKKMLENLEQAGIAPLTDENGQAKKIVHTLDSGYYSEQAVRELDDLGIDLYVATGRQNIIKASPRLVAWELPGDSGKCQGQDAPEVAKRRRLEDILQPHGVSRARFSQIKGARGFVRFLSRGLEKIRSEWPSVCLMHNLLKLWRSRCAPRAKRQKDRAVDRSGKGTE